MSRKEQTILVVDDEVKILDVVKSFLESEGYRAVTAKNGELGLRLFDSVNPDLLILDIIDVKDIPNKRRMVHLLVGTVDGRRPLTISSAG